MEGDEEHFRAPLIWLLAPYVAGIATACAGVEAGATPLAAAIAVVLALGAMVLARSPAPSMRVAWLASLALATALGGFLWTHHILWDQPRWRSLPARAVSVEVEVTRVFAPGDESARRSCLATITSAPAVMDDLVGQRVYFSAAQPDGVEFIRTMRVRLDGVIHSLGSQPQPAGSFEAYLAASAVRFKIARAVVVGVAKEPRMLPGSWHRLGARFEEILRHGLPPDHPAAHAYVAMFMGKRSELSDEQLEAFLRSGTMHLFAISGLHIGMIAYCLHVLLGVIRLPRTVAMVIGLLLLAAFVESTGGTPSARRALFMVAVLWIGHAIRRPANPLAALATAASGVLVVDPLALLSTSFQLSYSVVAALLLYGVPLRGRWLARWKPFRFLPEGDWRWWHHLVTNRGRDALTLVAISVAATCVSLPLGIALFGLGSPGALLSNVAVIPAAGLAVTAGFGSLVCGLVGALPLSVVFNHAGTVVVAAIERVAFLASKAPGMFFHGQFDAPWMGPVMVGGVLVLCVAGYASRWRTPRWSLWSPPLLVAAVLLLIVTPDKPGQESASMKSAYELAMERLKKTEPDSSVKLSEEQKAKLAEIDRVYQGRIAEREIFLNQRLAEAASAGQHEEMEKIRKQSTGERARLEEDREDEKNKVRRAANRG